MKADIVHIIKPHLGQQIKIKPTIMLFI